LGYGVTNLLQSILTTWPMLTDFSGLPVPFCSNAGAR
jgi:hypothetical protein